MMVNDQYWWQEYIDVIIFNNQTPQSCLIESWGYFFGWYTLGKKYPRTSTIPAIAEVGYDAWYKNEINNELNKPYYNGAFFDMIDDSNYLEPWDNPANFKYNVKYIFPPLTAIVQNAQQYVDAFTALNNLSAAKLTFLVEIFQKNGAPVQ